MSANELTSKQAKKRKKKRLTDITPSWSNIADMVVPYQLVDEDEQVEGKSPANVEYSACIACTEMRWGG